MKLTDEATATDYYLEWSTIVDAPVTRGMTWEKFAKYYKKQYGREGMRDFEARIDRVEKTGISAYPPLDNLAGYFDYNQAGYDGATASKEDVIRAYCRD